MPIDPPRVLIADDDDMARLLIRLPLEEAGFTVSEVSNGRDALDQFRTGRFDMIMLDVNMPGMNGYEACAAIRAEAGNELPIVMVTGTDDDESIERAFTAGATDFITKPINSSLIRHRVKYLLRAGQAAQELSIARASIAALLDAIPDLLFETNEDGRILNFHSPRHELLVTTPEQFLGRTISELLPPDAAEIGLAALSEAQSKGFSAGRQYGLDLPQGKCWFELSVTRKTDPSTREQSFVALSRDITARKQAEEKLQLAASVFSHAREAIVITTADGTIIDANAMFTRITGYERNEILGQNLCRLKSDRYDQEVCAAMWQGLVENEYWNGEIWNRRKNGEEFPQMLTISAVHDANGVTQNYVALISDISLLKEHEQRLEHIAHFDALTGLPNRTLLADRMSQALAQAQRRKQKLAVVYLDLDGFKAINDQYGHEIGDQFLASLADRMKDTLREGDTLARLGGDEFVALLIDLDDADASVPLLERLKTAAAKPVHLANAWLQVSASLGVAFYSSSNQVDADQLLRQADEAMYQAKANGKNRYHVFSGA